MKMRRLSVATFNLLNLNLPGLPLYDRPGWSEDVYRLKTDWTAGKIRLLAPDVMGFQELWHRDALADALDMAGLGDAYDLLAPDEADGGRITCAAIVRRGLLEGEPEWITDFPAGFRLQSGGGDPQTSAISVGIETFSRPVLHFAIRPRDDHPAIQVYVCHLKSKNRTTVDSEPWFRADPDLYRPHEIALGVALSTIRRTAEAAALRVLLTRSMEGPGTPAIVLGDVNDGQHSNTVNILTGQPRYLVGDSLGGGDTALYAAQTLQEYRNTRDVYYTHIYKDFMESLDHILVSEELYDNSRRRLWMFKGMTVHNDHLSMGEHKVSGTNDHGIVCATFEYRTARAAARAIMRADREVPVA